MKFKLFFFICLFIFYIRPISNGQVIESRRIVEPQLISPSLNFHPLLNEYILAPSLNNAQSAPQMKQPVPIVPDIDLIIIENPNQNNICISLSFDLKNWELECITPYHDWETCQRRILYLKLSTDPTFSTFKLLPNNTYQLIWNDSLKDWEPRTVPKDQ
jgi:hypothetical protein